MSLEASSDPPSAGVRAPGDKTPLRVFISYATQDVAVAQELAEFLNGAGAKAWYASSGIRQGTDWEHEIRKAIQSADWLVLLVSRASQKSPWVRTEVQEYIDLHAALSEASTRHILSLCLDDTRPDSLYMPLRLVQHLDFSPRVRADSQQKILAQLTSAPEVRPTPVPLPGKRFRPWQLIAALGACLVLFGSAFALWRPANTTNDDGTKTTTTQLSSSVGSAAPPLVGGPPPGMMMFPEVPPPERAPTTHPNLIVNEQQFILVDTRKPSSAEMSVLPPPMYYLASCETTLDQFNKFLEQTGQQKRDAPSSRGALPVTDVDRAAIHEYCEFLNALDGSPTQVRSATVGEWEFASLDQMTKLKASQLTAGTPPSAWLAENSTEMHVVGETQPTRLGIFDLFGNVSELATVDASHQFPELQGDRQAAVGGSWRTKQSSMQVTGGRVVRAPGGKANDLGFRVALTAADRPINVYLANKTKYDVQLHFYSYESTEWYGYEVSANSAEEKPGIMPGWNWCDVVRVETSETQRIGRRYFGFATKAWATFEDHGTQDRAKFDLTIHHYAADRVDGDSAGAGK